MRQNGIALLNQRNHLQLSLSYKKRLVKHHSSHAMALRMLWLTMGAELAPSSPRDLASEEEAWDWEPGDPSSLTGSVIDSQYEPRASHFTSVRL